MTTPRDELENEEDDMEEDVLGPLKELDNDKRTSYASCDRCGKPLAKHEVRQGPMRGDEREELCAACYEDFMKGELLPVDDEER